MAHGVLKKVEIKDFEDANKKIKREFFLPKWLYNEIIDLVTQEGSSFSFWVQDACRQKYNRQKEK